MLYPRKHGMFSFSLPTLFSFCSLTSSWRYRSSTYGFLILCWMWSRKNRTELVMSIGPLAEDTWAEVRWFLRSLRLSHAHFDSVLGRGAMRGGKPIFFPNFSSSIQVLTPYNPGRGGRGGPMRGGRGRGRGA